jgi:hypothetical protein
MKKFRKKPVVIEAEQWLGTDKQEKKLLSKGVIMTIPSLDGSCLIPTLEGNMTCQLNDYIIKGVKGEYYPCKPDIFELTYDVVEEVTLDHVVTAETLGDNPELAAEGVKVGENITVDAVEDVVPVKVPKKRTAKK